MLPMTYQLGRPQLMHGRISSPGPAQLADGAAAPWDSVRALLDACRYRHMIMLMARAATTSDVFNAIAEPQRREILALLRAGEPPVTEVARELGITQPGASKHLRVLREVGL